MLNSKLSFPLANRIIKKMNLQNLTILLIFYLYLAFNLATDLTAQAETIKFNTNQTNLPDKTSPLIKPPIVSKSNLLKSFNLNSPNESFQSNSIFNLNNNPNTNNIDFSPGFNNDIFKTAEHSKENLIMNSMTKFYNLNNYSPYSNSTLNNYNFDLTTPSTPSTGNYNDLTRFNYSNTYDSLINQPNNNQASYSNYPNNLTPNSRINITNPNELKILVK